MNHKTYHLITLAALLFAGAAFTACSTSSDNEIIEPTPTQPANGKYTLTVNASKVTDATTRALTLDGNTLNATWTKGDEVKVYSVYGEGPSEIEQDTPVGTLTAQRDGATTTLSGEFESTYHPTVGAKLRLKLKNDAVYTNQDGTLDYIATNCDKAVADIIVGTVDEETKAVTPTSAALFENQQAIVKFSLKQPDGITPLTTSNLTVKVGSSTYNVTSTEGASDIYVAVKEASSVKVTLTDNGPGPSLYFYSKSDVTFTKGQYYAISVKMKYGTVDLSAAGDLIRIYLNNGDIAYGTLARYCKVIISDDAEVTLNGVNINGDSSISDGTWEALDWAGITCEGNATINLVGTNTVRGFYKMYPGIYVPKDKTLTIQGDGSLDASSNGLGAGIGGGNNRNCGNIIIKGGTITATGGNNAAGIGGGLNASCGSITITNRVNRVTAIRGSHSKCIGKGAEGTSGKVKIGNTDYGTDGVVPNQDDNMTYIYQP